MNKRISKLLTGLIAALFIFASCGGGSAKADKKIVVGASPAPHAEILEEVRPLLEEKGYELEVKVFNDYVLPNQALDSGELDANFFQHIPFYDLQIADHGYEFAIGSKVHIEPIGLYSKRFDSVAKIPEGASVYFSNSVADHGRVLSLLEQQGLITLDPKVTDKTAAEVKDVKDNPKNLVFKTDFAPELLPQMYQNDEADIVIMNTNFAISAGINPLTESFVLEDSTSPYVNIIAVRAEDAESEKTKVLNEVLTSQEIKDFILEKYEGAVVPA